MEYGELKRRVFRNDDADRKEYGKQLIFLLSFSRWLVDWLSI